MEKQYQEWILQMHNTFDEESDCGEDEPIIILNPSNKKQLGISSDGKLYDTCQSDAVILLWVYAHYFFVEFV